MRIDRAVRHQVAQCANSSLELLHLLGTEILPACELEQNVGVLREDGHEVVDLSLLVEHGVVAVVVGDVHQPTPKREERLVDEEDPLLQVADQEPPLAELEVLAAHSARDLQYDTPEHELVRAVRKRDRSVFGRNIN